MVDELHAMRGVDVARHAERQAASGVVAVVHRIVVFPALEAPVSVRVFGGLEGVMREVVRIGCSHPGLTPVSERVFSYGSRCSKTTEADT